MNKLIIDTENSGAIRNKGQPFDPRNKTCLIGYRFRSETHIRDIEYSGRPYGDSLREVQLTIDKAEMVVGCNLKYDLHWLRRYGVNLGKACRIWDCQIAHFLITAQRKIYPSMDDMCIWYGLPPKDKKIEQYWDDGVDTDQIPLLELTEYLEGDLWRTEKIQEFQEKQLEELGLLTLFNVCCQDLLVLEEMEYNGMKYNVKRSLEKAEDLRRKESELTRKLDQIVGLDYINWESPDQLSSVLYGGTIKKETRAQIGFFKTGQRVGQPRYRTETTHIALPRLVEPIKGSELAKDGQFSTDAPTLQQLNAKGKAKQLIELVLELSETQKLLGTYYQGIPKKIVEFQWEEDIIHHALNQCVVVTGRLSSSKPNLQNVDRTVKECFISRYE